MIDTYFNDTPMKQWTVTGLALLFGSRQLLDDYQKRKPYSAMITYAKLMVENKYEMMLGNSTVTGAIFALKNFGWVDKTEIETSGSTEIIWKETKTYDTDK